MSKGCERFDGGMGAKPTASKELPSCWTSLKLTTKDPERPSIGKPDGIHTRGLLVLCNDNTKDCSVIGGSAIKSQLVIMGVGLFTMNVASVSGAVLLPLALSFSILPSISAVSKALVLKFQTVDMKCHLTLF